MVDYELRRHLSLSLGDDSATLIYKSIVDSSVVRFKFKLDDLNKILNGRKFYSNVEVTDRDSNVTRKRIRAKSWTRGNDIIELIDPSQNECLLLLREKEVSLLRDVTNNISQLTAS